MKPKEKAKELIDKYYPYIRKYDIHLDRVRGGMIVMKEAKECALIAVDEMIELVETMPKDIALHYIICLEQVKNEIERM